MIDRLCRLGTVDHSSIEVVSLLLSPFIVTVDCSAASAFLAAVAAVRPCLCFSMTITTAFANFRAAVDAAVKAALAPGATPAPVHVPGLSGEAPGELKRQLGLCSSSQTAPS